MFFEFLFLSVLGLSLCVESDLESRFSDITFEDEGEHRYQLNFTWPIDDILQLPAQGVLWELNSTALPPEPDGLRWIFTVTSPENRSEERAKVFLSLRLQQIPSNYSYVLVSAKCAILDADGNLKNIVKTGKNALLTPFSMRFDPFVYRRLLESDNTLLLAPNGTMVLDCSIDGVLKEHIVSRRVRHNGQVKSSMYPSRLDLLDQSGIVDKTEGTFFFNFTYEVDDFEEWPIVYSSGDTCFNGSRNILHWQFRLHNPSNNHYPLFVWFGFEPARLNNFASACSCGVMNSNGHKVFNQTVRVNATGPTSFFEFPRFMDCDLFDARKPVLIPDGLLKVNCIFEGSFASSPGLLDDFLSPDLVDCTS